MSSRERVAGLRAGGAAVSLGQAAFYGIGGYASAILTTRYTVNPWLGILAGAALSAWVAWMLGSVIFRIQGHYLSLATLPRWERGKSLM